MNFQIRPAMPEDGPELAYVRITTWQATYAGIVPDAYLREMDLAAESQRWTEGLASLAERGNVAFMAEHLPDGCVVGYCIAGPERTGDPEYPSELFALYVLPEYQGHGLGRALVQAAARALQERGYRRVIIFVLSENRPARRFYEAIGGTVVREKEVEIGGESLPEVGYGYELAAL